MTTDLPLRAMRVLISGAGVAGPALACWLARYGAATTVVEAAPALRGGGFGVDFRGPTHLGVLERTGGTPQAEHSMLRADQSAPRDAR
jgi:2-polyprenyl-6-methoxyphenol hydroxylase-like FAD-dependent oxidoreductase